MAPQSAEELYASALATKLNNALAKVGSQLAPQPAQLPVAQPAPRPKRNPNRPSPNSERHSRKCQICHHSERSHRSRLRRLEQGRLDRKTLWLDRRNHSLPPRPRYWSRRSPPRKPSHGRRESLGRRQLHRDAHRLSPSSCRSHLRLSERPWPVGRAAHHSRRHLRHPAARPIRQSAGHYFTQTRSQTLPENAF